MPPLTFSRRLPPLEANRLAAARAARPADRLIDLSVSNPTVVGLGHPPDLVAPLADPRGLRYEPCALGLPEAREAVARDYARHRASISPESIVLTASTSEGYGFLFKVLCDPGDEVLVPAPSYPLFDHLSRLDAVTARPYPLEYHGVWSIDLAALEQAVGPRTRALLVVTPNNPTGSFLRQGQWERLRDLCASARVALVCDEVFVDYPLDPAADAVRCVTACAREARDLLVVTLGGLSKSVGLPQHKLAWMVLQGSPALVDEARARLELVCDTYLSVSTAVQLAAGRLLEEGARVRTAIAERLSRNLSKLRARALAAPSCEVLSVEGGWSAVVRVPAVRSDETLALELLERDGVVVQPGYFFDFPSEAFLVISLLPEAATFDRGIDRLFRRAAA